MADPTSDTGRIERDLDQTRSRLGSHLSELQGRLSPGQVLDDLMGVLPRQRRRRVRPEPARQRARQPATGGDHHGRPSLADGVQPARDRGRHSRPGQRGSASGQPADLWA